MCCVVVVRDYRCVDGIVHTHVLLATGGCASRHGVNKYVIHSYIEAACRLITANYMILPERMWDVVILYYGDDAKTIEL